MFTRDTDDNKKECTVNRFKVWFLLNTTKNSSWKISKFFSVRARVKKLEKKIRYLVALRVKYVIIYST